MAEKIKGKKGPSPLLVYELEVLSRSQDPALFSEVIMDPDHPIMLGKSSLSDEQMDNAMYQLPLDTSPEDREAALLKERQWHGYRRKNDPLLPTDEKKTKRPR